MALTITATHPDSGKNLAVTLQRVGDGWFWDNNIDEAWEGSAYFVDNRIALTEGVGEEAGLYLGSNSGDLGNAGWIRVRVHDEDAGNRTIAAGKVYVEDGNELAVVERNVGSVASVTGGVTFSTAALQAIWNEATAGMLGAGTIGKHLVDRLDAAISSLNDISTTEVHDELSSILSTQMMAELAAGTPPASPSVHQALMLLYMWLRNNTEVTSSSRKVRDDAGVTVAQATLIDDGSTFTQGRLEAP